MSQFGTIKPSVGKVVFLTVLAFVLGIFVPFMTLFQVMLPMSAISLTMLIAVAMYAGAGPVPAAVFGVFGALSSVFFLGMTTGAASLLLWLIPAVFVIVGIRKKRPFFQQMTIGVGCTMGAAVLAIVMMTLAFGSDLINQAMNLVIEAFEAQKNLFWQAMQPALQSTGVKTTIEEFSEIYYGMFRTLKAYYEYYLLSNLLTGSVISAVISVLWGNWLMARRGEATSESFRGLSEWYMPANVTYGLLLCLAAGYIIVRTKLAGAETAWIVTCSICSLAFEIQFFAALDRRQKRAGASRGRRIGMVVLLLLMSTLGIRFFGVVGLLDLMAILGCASALFGSKGAARPWIDKIKGNMDGEDR